MNNWSAKSRAQLLSRVKKLSAQRFGEKGLGLSVEQWRASDAEEQQILEEYAENIPYLAVSRCPLCNQALEVTIDTMGLDGPWWWKHCPVDLAPHIACDHFQVFLGALNLNGRQPNEVTKTVIAGPSLPFVNDRLLQMDGVVAVLSEISIDPGYQGYMIAYFSEEPLDQADLHQEWRHETYGLLNDDGEPVAAEQKLDLWNFNLADWLGQGKLYFISPQDDSLKLGVEMPSRYENMEGIKMEQSITNGEIWLLEPPDGEETAIYEPAN